MEPLQNLLQTSFAVQTLSKTSLQSCAAKPYHQTLLGKMSLTEPGNSDANLAAWTYPCEYTRNLASHSLTCIVGRNPSHHGAKSASSVGHLAVHPPRRGRTCNGGHWRVHDSRVKASTPPAGAYWPCERVRAKPAYAGVSSSAFSSSAFSSSASSCAVSSCAGFSSASSFLSSLAFSSLAFSSP